MSKLDSKAAWLWRCFQALALTGLIGWGQAMAQNDAYSIRVAVADRSDQEQQSAYVVGMRSVLLANSGDKTLLNRDDVRAGLRAADTYVELFRYDTPDAGTVISRNTPLTDAVRQSGEATQLMFIQFNPQLINELIRSKTAEKNEEPEPEESLDPFANARSSLLWLIVEDGGEQTLVGAAAGRNVMDRAREIAGAAGMVLSFPAGDSKDVQAVSMDDIKTGNAERISAAAARYAQPLVLAAHLTRTRTGSWEGTWVKTAAGQIQNEAFSSRNLDDALQQGIAWLSPQAAAGNLSRDSFSSGVVNNSSSAEGLLWVSPLRTTDSYAEVMRFLTSIDGVVSAYPKEVLTGGMVFAVVPRNALSAVTSAASANAWLQQSSMPSSAGASQFAQGISVSFEYLR